MIEIIKPGSKVQIGNDIPPLEGRLIAFLLNMNLNMKYLVGYWDGKTWREEWLPTPEVSPSEDAEMMRIE